MLIPLEKVSIITVNCVLLCALQELQKRAHTRLSRRERLRREIMEAKEMELPDQVNIWTIM